MSTHEGDSSRNGTPDEVTRELKALGAQIGALQGEVRRLAGGVLPHDEASGWDDTDAAVTHGWVAGLQTPRRSAPRIPRLPLELAFLAAAATLAGIADLRPLEIVAVMAGAWMIVSLAEWAASRGDRLRAQLLLAPPPLPTAPQPGRSDPAWFSPPVEQTLLGSGDEPSTVVAKLPPAQDPEQTAESRRVH